ncbi:Sensor histidine kinase of a two component response regulator [Croceitalea dokdonensis DOKDO 023]|uniref:Sensor histidine kinase of a two component response regulator n=1 Tax=Croceitalea dokdonensis DOKDO 023 TaxID=1300341 RepID=A0A0P7AY12_9FLAO|nr:type IV pili methyl-accepting chemotaxis transducer N-terminal domain-containing protein [Croceitalea dokdonensis]KPM33727.1 Sensor histidine kinase of a two component response regulator [Croceitalea dokdonensis DOKDO 023]
MNNSRFFKKGFRAYYLLVVSIIILTIAIQSITQYSLNKQRGTAMLVNLAGRQRMLSVRLLAESYTCRYDNCNFAEFKITLNKLVEMHTMLQTGDKRLGIPKLDDERILAQFAKLDSHVNWLRWNLGNVEEMTQVHQNDIRYRTNRFIELMDDIVLQFQKKSENDIKGIRIVELELAIFSVVIVLFEIFFIVNPIINRIFSQKKKLEEIAWHQSHVFSSHMKNIADLQYVLKVEKRQERRDEILAFISEEIDKLKGVSDAMLRALSKDGSHKNPHHQIMAKMEQLLAKRSKNQSSVTDDDKVHS